MVPLARLVSLAGLARLVEWLGWAALLAGQSGRAQELMEQELAHARAAGDPLAEKSALERLGHVAARQRQPARALLFYEQALALARQVGDQQQQADLLWSLGIQHAELGQRDQALAQAQAAVDLLRSLGKPQAAWFADHLHRYRLGASGVGPGANREVGPAGPPGVFWVGASTPGVWASPLGPGLGPEPAARGPGLLRMAVSAGKAMAQFVGSGFKTVPAATQQQRIQTCAGCEHHTGVRCRLCGCFTHVKAWLPHEECPLRKWPQ